KPADDALSAWRAALTDPDQGPRTQAAAKQAAFLGKRLWAPLRDVLPADLRLVWVVPEGALAGLPWAALPGRKADTILLEDHGVAVLPSAPFLLEQLKAPLPKAADPAVLALGGVDYDRAPTSPGKGLGLRSPALPEGKKLSWPALKGTAAEAERVLALA